jgi:hypothetical protein
MLKFSDFPGWESAHGKSFYLRYIRYTGGGLVQFAAAFRRRFDPGQHGEAIVGAEDDTATEFARAPNRHFDRVF